MLFDMSVLDEEFDPAQLPSLDADARFERNALAPICRLPVDILILVLHYIQDTRGRNRRASFLADFTSEWTCVMLVCRHFRAVAVQTPTLWSAIDLRCAQEWVDLCLERTQGNIPLQISDRRSGSKEIEPYLHRAQSAVLRGDLTEVLCAPGLKLRALEVSCDRKERGNWLVVSSSTFGGKNLLLRTLRLRGFAVSLFTGAPAMPHLRELQLELITTNFTALARLWSATPRLEHLYLRSLQFSDTCNWSQRHLPYEPDMLEPVPAKVCLPHLKTLRISEELVAMSALVRMLPTPNVMLHLQLQTYAHYSQLTALGENYTEIYAACLPFLRKLLDQDHVQGGTHVRYMTRYWSDGSQVGGSFRLTSPHTYHYTPTYLPHHTVPALSFDFDCPINRPHFLLDTIETLHLEFSSEGREDTIACDPVEADSFATLTHLHTLIVDMPLPRVDWIRNWVIGRRGQIKEVKLAHSFTPPQIATLEEELRKEGLAPRISQLPPPSPDAV
jgi:hypothetical protein